MPKISIIVPCYFNEENIPQTTLELIKTEKLFDKNVEFEYIMVDDGSKDATLPALEDFYSKYQQKVKIVKLTRNVGSNNASLAGMHYATGDCCVVIAADLQDPPDLIPKMYDYWKKGIKLVIANKEMRQDPFLQKLFSNTYHCLIKKLALKNAPKGGFDLFLFDRQLRDAIVSMNEKNTYLPYLLLWLGYDYVAIPYTRRKRKSGKSQWTFAKKVKSFIDSFVAFTFFPIRIISVVGILLGFTAAGYAISIIYANINGNIAIEGWSSLIVVVLCVSAFQMIALGIIGEYVWRNLDASRKRPNFVVEEFIDKTS